MLNFHLLFIMARRIKFNQWHCLRERAIKLRLLKVLIKIVYLKLVNSFPEKFNVLDIYFFTWEMGFLNSVLTCTLSIFSNVWKRGSCILSVLGVAIPLGGLVANKLPPSKYGISDSEYIINNEDQCALRYIIQFQTIRN